MRSPWHDTPGRRARWYALIAAVLALHLVVGDRLAASLSLADRPPMPRRIAVHLVKPLMPSVPPVAAAALAVPPAPPSRAPRRPHPRAASAPEDAASASHAELRAQALALAASMALAEPPPASAPPAAASAAAAPAMPASTALAQAGAASAVNPAASAPRSALQTPYDWPPSTHLAYKLTGLYRNGPLYGDGVVEWRRDGAHYQVEFNFSVPPFLEGHLFSDGQITAEGLQPVHFEEWRKLPLRAVQTRRIEFLADEVVLSNGERPVRLAQTQDPSSQFVQFVWMFTTQPQWLTPGTVVSLPLALPNKLRVWHYRVDAPEVLSLPFGPLEAVRLVPIDPRQANELAFEIWIAPSLQYLPVRIHVPLNEENFVDLTLDSRPLQAAAPEPASAPMTLP